MIFMGKSMVSGSNFPQETNPLNLGESQISHGGLGFSGDEADAQWLPQKG